MNSIPPLVEISPSSFDHQVRASLLPVLVAVNSGGVNGQSAPLLSFEEASLRYHRRAAFARLNLDKYPDLASQLGIASAPALLLFQSGELTYQFIGHWTPRDLADILGRLERVSCCDTPHQGMGVTTDLSSPHRDHRNVTAP